MKTIIIRPHGAPGNFSLTCSNREQLKKMKEHMAFKGFIPIETYKKSTNDGVEYILVYSIHEKMFRPLIFN